ncbi:uncharacterized protein LOC131233152 [Magnolia sinica]|uniref:uncharacterized protein LOC131233152 n=1 Tax=Magnolia sinica TaxID=86752 RepID=UPI00265939E6|nr:uncharacterized protein LOC131233152 [Magnolia sinica]
MRCKRHPFEQGVGVCAACLRERLLALIEAQSKENRRKSDPQPPPPPPLAFPRSVSPYICRRSDTWQHHNQHQFYSTPQVGPTFSSSTKKKSRFSVFSSLFGASRSEETERDNTVPISSTSSSWFSAFRKKKSRLFSLDDEISGNGARRSCRTRDRGMSPKEGDETPIQSGFSVGSSPGWRKSAPVTAVSAAPRRSQHGRNVSGFAFCLSPLVRPSPSRHRSDTGFSDELRSANRHHLSTAASLCANRSRKLADIGRASLARTTSSQC